MARRNSNPLVAIGYVRVSTSDQKLGPEAQRAEVEAWASREGITIAAWFADAGVSGATAIGERPGLLAAVAALRTHNAGVLIAAKRDRIARDVVVAAMIDRAVAGEGATVRTVDGAGDGIGPEGELMRTMIDAFAAFERGKIRGRTRAALAVKRARGEKLGGRAPYGFRADGIMLAPEPSEQAIIATVKDLAATGLSQRAIAAELASRGMVGRTGQPFGQSQISRML